MRQLLTALAASAAAGVLASTAAAQPAYGILPQAPDSRERQAPINALRSKGAELARAFAPHVLTNAKGERMPYRLFTPARLQPGRRYPLVVFLHGAGGSGTDNVKQLQDANVFGALVWTLPENQARHPAFVVAPQSDVNWPCTLYDPQKPPKTLADILPPPGSRWMRRARGPGGSFRRRPPAVTASARTASRRAPARCRPT